MIIWNSAGALLLAQMLVGLDLSVAETKQNNRQMQFCWSLGTFDRTVYFAETSVLDDRKESFTEMLDISGIDHILVECRFLDAKQRTVILKMWSDALLEIVNTTFLSDLGFHLAYVGRDRKLVFTALRSALGEMRT